MAATWPDSLQLRLAAQGLAVEHASPLARTPDELRGAAPDKVRRRSTIEGVNVRGTVHVGAAEYAVLMTFFNSTLAGGTLPFEWEHPVTQEAVLLRFVAPPQVSPAGPRLFRAALDLELIPS